MESQGATSFFAVVLWLALALPAGAQTLVFAPLPMQSLAQTQAANQPLADLLGDLLGRRVDMRLYPDHADLLEGLARGEVDFAELGPLPLLMAKERMTTLTEVASFREPDGRAVYRCVLVAAVDGIRALTELGPRLGQTTVALTRAESTCGPTVTFSLLADQGVDPALLAGQYHGTHDDVALAVLRQLHPIGGMKESAARRFHDLGLRILAASEPVPGFVLVSRTDGQLAAHDLENLQKALLALDPDQRAGLQNGRHGFEPFDDRLQEHLQAMRVFAAPYLRHVEP
ncbi:MAG: PhnD/SsuA/transferrin family substrate-binding protein [Wenzhouxiangella sp.]